MTHFATRCPFGRMPHRCVIRPRKPPTLRRTHNPLVIATQPIRTAGSRNSDPMKDGRISQVDSQSMKIGHEKRRCSGPFEACCSPRDNPCHEALAHPQTFLESEDCPINPILTGFPKILLPILSGVFVRRTSENQINGIAGHPRQHVQAVALDDLAVALSHQGSLSSAQVSWHTADLLASQTCDWHISYRSTYRS
ncbi:hypothetical protein LCGC14_1255840 [marine sediment metagenome]|uniref:Uncharacterized protein n=1 Tax=marine sediment metagenome TaxID=412755 RepID=A0A0F9L4W5_9ZZZZ